ncbi:MAG: hypothetical protein M5T52_22875 [Ignavibacteriaceae bacterium]|nr:hypothetical protein [Ignavibacteriaceae bacterium]
MDEQGNPIPINENPEYLNNQIIVQFKPSSISLPAGQYKSSTTLITASQVVRDLLNREQVTTVEKVFRKATEGDTLKTLVNGMQVKVQDLTQYFLLSFDKAINIEEKDKCV